MSVAVLAVGMLRTGQECGEEARERQNLIKNEIAKGSERSSGARMIKEWFAVPLGLFNIDTLPVPPLGLGRPRLFQHLSSSGARQIIEFCTGSTWSVGGDGFALGFNSRFAWGSRGDGCGRQVGEEGQEDGGVALDDKIQRQSLSLLCTNVKSREAKCWEHTDSTSIISNTVFLDPRSSVSGSIDSPPNHVAPGAFTPK